METVELHVGKDATVGGDAKIRGTLHIGHNARVEGWLDAPNIRTPFKGLFETSEKLKASYMDPRPGWHALVGKTIPAQIWVVKNGEWQWSGNYGGSITFEGKLDNYFTDRGLWATDRTYYAGEANTEGKIETSEVWHRGQKWRCVATNQSSESTEPGIATSDIWQWISGDPDPIVTVVSDGPVMYNGQGEKTLTAIVMYHGEDITDTIPQARFSWKRECDGGDGDKFWNDRHKYTGNVITVTKDEIDGRARFFCEVIFVTIL